MNVRFNPSANGNLHLGHLFTLLVNNYYAKSRKGKLIVRFDDTTPNPRATGNRLDGIIQSRMDDIRWLGLDDGFIEWQRQSFLFPKVYEILEKFGMEKFKDAGEGKHYLPLVIAHGTDWVTYPYVPLQTAERVVMDNMFNISHLIRGDDFIAEYTLYRYFCDMFGYEYPEFTFLPRLRARYGDISKTKGGYKISDFRANGYTPEQVIHMLEVACLFYPNNGWEFYNIKPEPRLEI